MVTALRHHQTVVQPVDRRESSDVVHKARRACYRRSLCQQRFQQFQNQLRHYVYTSRHVVVRDDAKTTDRRQMRRVDVALQAICQQLYVPNEEHTILVQHLVQ